VAVLGAIMLALVGLHVAAAFYHYLIRRDGVMQRMLPGSSTETLSLGTSWSRRTTMVSTHTSATSA